MSCVALFIMTSLGGCRANDVPTDWKSDCVGRIQLSFPGDVEVAANSAKTAEAGYIIGNDQPRFEFADGQYAGWSTLVYLGRLYASHPLSAAERERLAMSARQSAFRTLDAVRKKKKDKAGNALVFEELDTKPFVGEASRVNAAYNASLFVGDTLFWISLPGYDTTWKDQRNVVDGLLAGLASRQIGSIPIKPGVCVPYMFVGDDGQPRRHIAMTYRLREHPDITIMLEDSSAVEIDPKANPEVYDPEGISDSFWSRYDNTYRKSLRSVWSTPYRRIKLADSKGLESFVKIVRDNDAVDYGYLVVARGDPKAKEDTPDLMLYVIQDSKNAKAKGIEPLGKDAFLAMAQTVAASVKRRPTSP
jgi:hypothetical protein